MFLDPMYLFFVFIPSIVTGLFVQNYIKSRYNKFSQVPVPSGRSGREVAQAILQANGIHDVGVKAVRGRLTDNYNPLKKIVNLSETVYRSHSVAAAGIAAHECGHALQHAGGYGPLMARNAIVPVVNIGNFLVWPLVILGLILRLPVFINLGIVFFLGVILFHLITLPVEFNASKRAVAALQGAGILRGANLAGARQVLNAAALSYVGATLVAILNLVYLLSLRGRR